VIQRRRVRLGSWTCPSGNSVAAFYCSSKNAPARLELRWDEPPPLCPDDEHYYLKVVRPGVLELVREYTERIGAVAVIEL
jgi:hypothetical protein